MNFKRKQMESKIKIFLAEIILEELNIDTLRNTVSIVDVRLSTDFKRADVFVNFITKENKEREVEALLALLNKERGIIRSLLSKKLTLKFAPTIEFKVDELIDDINKLEGIIEDISK